MDNDGESIFYAEIHTPTSIRDNYAPEANCEACGAKLSRYRSQAYGEWEKYCAPCQRLDRHLERLCAACGVAYSNHGGDRIYCSKCIVPSVREERRKTNGESELEKIGK